ncbi:hypothetical protein MOE86_15440 [Bacillus atrophaeus]|uniref:hypothetical protein n=1 Tax=Bacillus atrophaeus TaxID=1452 RepID=UPI002280ADDE|nr:hypothetical protein [Bacillus atrophaeus]MCY9198071.1 hypothetical protein [Bacillus atrophaeus]
MKIRKVLEELLKDDEKEKVCRLDHGLVLNLEMAKHELTCVESKAESFMRYLIAKKVDNVIANAEEKYKDEMDTCLQRYRAAWNDIFKSAMVPEEELDKYEYKISSLGILYRFHKKEESAQKAKGDTR